VFMAGARGINSQFYVDVLSQPYCEPTIYFLLWEGVVALLYWRCSSSIPSVEKLELLPNLIFSLGFGLQGEKVIVSYCYLLSSWCLMLQFLMCQNKVFLWPGIFDFGSSQVTWVWSYIIDQSGSGGEARW
jgi:hypothetical protein